MNNKEQPTTTTWSRRKKIFVLFLVVSLIVHIITLLFIFNVSFRKRSIKLMQELFESLTPAERKKQALQRQEFMQKIRAIKLEEARTRPAKLRAPKSDFGWVFFEDIPAPSKHTHAEIPTTLEGPVASAPTAFATEIKAEPAVPGPAVTLPPAPQLIPKPMAAQPETAPKPPTAQPQPAVQQPHVKQKKAPPLVHVRGKKQLKTTTKPLAAGPEATPKTQTIFEEKPTALAPETAEKPMAPPRETGKKPTARRRAPGKKQKETIIDSLVDELKHEVADESSDEESTTELVEHHEQFFEDFVEPQEPTPDIKARIEKITHMQEQLSHFGGSAGIKPGTNTPGGGKPATAKVRGARAAKPKTGREIIALTKGFVEKHEGEEGTDLIDRDGDDTKMPSFEEMKYISYEANINWCLQSSWKQNFAYLQQESPHNTTAVIEFTLDAKGYVTRAELLQSSGYKSLDTMIMKNIKYASPFPPVPKHFGVKEYTTGRLIHVIYNNFGL